LRPAGLEPASPASEASVLSPVLWAPEPVYNLVVPDFKTTVFERKTSRSLKRNDITLKARRNFVAKNRGFKMWGKIRNRL
jgi:hypothetical protein